MTHGHMGGGRALALAGVLLTGTVPSCASPPAAPATTARPVWIDTDPAAGLPDRDVDDGLALVQAFASPTIAVRGVSVVFGNVPLADGAPIAASLVARFGPPEVEVFEGASSAEALGRETPASRALAARLAAERLTVIALGPATNVATVLLRHPELARQIDVVVAVAGRRPGQRFTTGTTNTAAHRDLNFELDPDAFRVLLEADVPLRLAPFEVSSQVWITEADLMRLADGGEAARWLTGPSRAWLRLWREVFGVDGFNPFDTLAVAAVATPDLLTCERLPAALIVGPDDGTEARMQGTAPVEKPYLVVSPDLDGARLVDYCGRADPAFKDHLIQTLADHATAR